MAEGCRDALIVCKILPDFDVTKRYTDKYLLVDGHNRYAICKKHLIQFRVEVKHFENLDEVKQWMINNQLGKRNLTNEQIAYYRGLQYNQYKKDRNANLVTKGQNVQSEKEATTAEKIAKNFNVAPKTIQRDAKFAEGLNLLGTEIRNAIFNGSFDVKKNVIEKITPAEVEKIKEQFSQNKTKYESTKKETEKELPQNKSIPSFLLLEAVARTKKDIQQVESQIADYEIWGVENLSNVRAIEYKHQKGVLVNLKKILSLLEAKEVVQETENIGTGTNKRSLGILDCEKILNGEVKEIYQSLGNVLKKYNQERGCFEDFKTYDSASQLQKDAKRMEADERIFIIN